MISKYTEAVQKVTRRYISAICGADLGRFP